MQEKLHAMTCAWYVFLYIRSVQVRSIERPCVLAAEDKWRSMVVYAVPNQYVACWSAVSVTDIMSDWHSPKHVSVITISLSVHSL
jgi:hypothetical protein